MLAAKELYDITIPAIATNDPTTSTLRINWVAIRPIARITSTVSVDGNPS